MGEKAIRRYILTGVLAGGPNRTPQTNLKIGVLLCKVGSNCKG